MNTLSPDAQQIARQFLKNEYRDYIGYQALLSIEKNKQFKEILTKLIQHEKEDVDFWREIVGEEPKHIDGFQTWRWKMMRRILGLTFTARYLERGEHEAVAAYEAIQDQFGAEHSAKIKKMIAHEREHEEEMLSQIKEDKVDFISNIILGLNDGLIELSGALVGFTFALRDTTLVGASGLITGIAASLSMAASAYLQAKHEEHDKDAKKASLYTGGAYVIVVMSLIAPYFIFSSTASSLIGMGAVVFCIIFAMSAYSSVLFNRSFKRQFLEIAIFSLGTAIVAFLIGSLVDVWLLS